jgi:hypothetical protein
MSACEVISLYSEINKRCIEEAEKRGEKKPAEFLNLTKIMFAVIEILKNLVIEIELPN